MRRAACGISKHRQLFKIRLVGLSRRGRLALGIANGRVLADDTCVYVARDMRVGLVASAT